MNTLIIVDDDLLIAGDNNKRFIIVMNLKWKDIVSNNDNGCDYDYLNQLVRYIEIIQNLNPDIKIKAKLAKFISIHIYQVYASFHKFLKTKDLSIPMPPKMCANCGDREDPEIKMKRCSACKIVHYCSTSCQNLDWKFHKKNCNNDQCHP